MKRGKVFKVKYGYNPNSSSIGTHINSFLSGAALISIITTGLYAFIRSIKGNNKDGDNEAEKK